MMNIRPDKYLRALEETQLLMSFGLFKLTLLIFLEISFGGLKEFIDNIIFEKRQKPAFFLQISNFR